MCKLRVGQWDSRCFGLVGNGQICLGVMFTALGMLTKQCQCSKQFGNAADGFGNAIDGSGRPGMDSGLVRDCLGGVWTASRHD